MAWICRATQNLEIGGEVGIKAMLIQLGLKAAPEGLVAGRWNRRGVTQLAKQQGTRYCLHHNIPDKAVALNEWTVFQTDTVHKNVKLNLNKCVQFNLSVILPKCTLQTCIVAIELEATIQAHIHTYCQVNLSWWVWTAGGSWYNIRRNPCRHGGQHAHFNLKGPSWPANSNQEPSCSTRMLVL